MSRVRKLLQSAEPVAEVGRQDEALAAAREAESILALES
jgi:hypothetical protein